MLGQLLNPVHRLVDSLRRDTARTLLMAAALGLVGWLVLYPLAILLLLGLHDKDGAWTFDNYRAVFTEPRLVGALANSVIVSAATLVASLALALPLAWGVARTRMPGKWMVNVAVTIAFVIPNFIGAIAWILLLGKNAGLLNVLARQVFGGFLFDVYSIPGLVLVLALSFFPIIYFSAQAALENIDPMYEEAAQMSGAPAWRASLGISLPLVLPAIVSSSVLVFLEAMAAFGAPAAIATGGNFHLLTTELYDMFSYPPRFELAAASASPIIGFTLLGLGERCAAALSDLKSDIVKPYLIGPGGLIDDAGHAAHAYRQDTLFLIRPDGYIGLIADADNALAVTGYLRSL